MRRWHLQSRLRREPGRHDSDRCVLVVEQLEAREVLSPVVIAPTFLTPQPPENVSYTFSGSSAFLASDTADSGQNYEADLTAANGTISVTPITGLTVTNNGTGAVTVVGQLNAINILLSSGVTYQSIAFYSGDAAVTVTVTDLVNGGAPGTGSVGLKVQPVASDATFAVAATGEVLAPSSGFAFPPGFVAVGSWPDADGSETVTVTFSLGAPDPSLFTLSARGVPITPVEPGLWQVTGTSQAALASLLDSLVLTPPAGFTGRADLSVSADIRDQALYSDATTATNGHSLGAAFVPLRFFVGGSVTTPTAFALEGGTIDLGGRYVASDPDELGGDAHTLALSVPDGTLTFDPNAVPSGLTAVRDAGPTGTTVLLTGDIAAINQFLATPGSLAYTPGSSTFAGVVPLTLTLTNYPFDPQIERPSATAAPGQFTGVAALAFGPIADHVVPSAVDVVTDQDTPVALSITVPALPDNDGSESVLVLLEGVPTGATLNRGTDLGGGEWALSPSDLAGLVLTPPAGASGTFTLGVRAVVTDAAPALGLSDAATESTAFTVTVIPAAAVEPVDPAVLLLDVEDETAAEAVDTVVPGDAVGAVDTGTNTDDETETDARIANAPVLINAYASATGTDPAGATDNRAGDAPGPGSLFAQVEVPLPSYAYGEKHPLPPVLPLDQTLPVAGFSDSGGDSFALIDKLYRDAAAERFSLNQIGAAPAPPDAATVVSAAPVPAVAVVPENDAGTGDGSVPAADAPEGDWRVWTAAVAIVGALAAWAWLARASAGAPARAIGRLLRTLHRRPTQRTV